jgi:hypothetical protein
MPGFFFQNQFRAILSPLVSKLLDISIYTTMLSYNICIGIWIKSSNEKYADQPVEIRAPKNIDKELENDYGIVLSQASKHYGFGTKYVSCAFIRCSICPLSFHEVLMS